MRTRDPQERRAQRVLLRQPIVAAIGQEPALILELGLTGVKIEHADRLAVGESQTLTIADVRLQGVVRYSTVLPAPGTIVYHTGIEFQNLSPQQGAALYELLLTEAQQQVLEWEANLEGITPQRSTKARESVVVHRYIWLRYLNGRWERLLTSDPNQPLDGVAVPDDEPEEAIALLCADYEKADERMREYLRSCATVAILERIRP
jgi:hypothetical protein